MALRRLRLAALLSAGLLLTFAPSSRAEDEDVVDDQDIEEESMTAEALRALHGKFDHNGDGKVSLGEVMGFAHAMGKAIAAKDVTSILDEVDLNKDGQLSLDEHLSDIHNQADGGDEEEMKELEKKKIVETEKFKAADSNGDQVLSTEEVASLFYPETHTGVLEVSVKETMRQKDQNGDSKLSAKEFWEFGADDVEDTLTEEEAQDFAKLDKDNDGLLDIDELMAWESGLFHTEAAMIKLLEIADTDGDMHATADEFVGAREELAASDAQYHLIEWAEHHEL